MGSHCASIALLRSIVVCTMILTGGLLCAQQDSVAVYDDIHEIAAKRKFTKVLFDAIFVAPAKGTKEDDGGPSTRRNPHRRYAGRTIGCIRIHVLDPFSTDVRDTLAKATNWVERMGNMAHQTTRERVVRGLLLFQEGDVLDPMNLEESERILRSFRLANDALITVLPNADDNSVVDILVIVQDRWSLEVGASGDPTSANVRIAENNLLGMGQFLEQELGYTLGHDAPELKGTHRVYNFGRSYVGSTVRYRSSQALDEVVMALDRPFFSPLAKWAGSMTSGHSWYRPGRRPGSTSELSGTVRTSTFDMWSGLSLKTTSDTSERARGERIVLSARYAEQNHKLSPSLQDSLHYIDPRTALVSVQFSEQRFRKERFLYRFGSTEDLAIGRLLNLTAGTQWEPGGRALPYSGISYTHAVQTDRGRYVLANMGMGTFWRNGNPTDTRISATLYGFSGLLGAGRWRIRQFFTCSFSKAVRPVSPMALDLRGDQFIRMDPVGWFGDQRLLLRTETVAYAPFSVLGFRFAPILVMALGTLGAEHQRLDQATYRSAIGLGLLIRNERLLVNTFRISFAYYPGIPPEMGGPLRYNALNSLDVRSPGLAPGAPGLITP